jgi:serine/threonine protein phosphatase PrpC
MTPRYAGRTHKGLVRQHNEDSLLVMPELRAAAVADGMGGHRSGDVASQLCIETLREFLEVTVDSDGTWPFPMNLKLSEEENCAVAGLRLANRRIFERSLRTPSDFGMGTTCVALLASRNATRVTVGHVGDSRAYLLRGDQIMQLTRDHSLQSDAEHVAPWLTPDELAQLPPNVITRALGVRDDVVVDVATHPVQPGDTFLLCSDGLNGMLTDAEILAAVRGAPSLEGACASLIEHANAAGGVDNITAVLVRFEGGGDAEAVAQGDATPESGAVSSEAPSDLPSTLPGSESAPLAADDRGESQGPGSAPPSGS